MNGHMKDYFQKNLITLLLLAGMIALYLCIPSQISENMVAKAAVSPRFFPTFSIVGVMICCVLLLAFDAKDRIIAARKKIAPAAKEKSEAVSYARVALLIVLLFAWCLLMPLIGFTISTVVSMVIMSYLLGCRNKLVLVIFPLVFTLVVYFVFVQLLHVSLPEILF